MIASNEYCIAEDTTFFSKGFLKRHLWLGQALHLRGQRASALALLLLSRFPGPEETATGREGA